MSRQCLFGALAFLMAFLAACQAPAQSPSPQTLLPPRTAQLLSERSLVFFQKSGQVREEVPPNSIRSADVGDEMWTQSQGRALLKFPDLWVRLYDDTEFHAVDETPPSLKMALGKGAVLVGEAPQSPKRVEVLIGVPSRVRILLTGTLIMIVYIPTEETILVRTFDGSVIVVVLASGQSIQSTRDRVEWVLIGSDNRIETPSRDDIRALARHIGFWDLYHEIELDAGKNFGPSGASIGPEKIVMTFVETLVRSTPTAIAPAGTSVASETRPQAAIASSPPSVTPIVPSPRPMPTATSSRSNWTPTPQPRVLSPTSTQTPGNAVIVLHNNTQTTIVHVYFGTAAWGGWSGEQLSDLVPPGSTYTWQLQPGAGIYDLRAEDRSHTILDQRLNVSVSGTYHWYIGGEIRQTPTFIPPPAPTATPKPPPAPTATPNLGLVVPFLKPVISDVKTELVQTQMWLDQRPVCGTDKVRVSARVTSPLSLKKVEMWRSDLSTWSGMTSSGGDVYVSDQSFVAGNSFRIRAEDKTGNVAETDLLSSACVRAECAAALKLYWSSARQDNSSVATIAGEQDAMVAGYRLVRTEGHVATSQLPGTVPLKLYWYAGLSDNLTTAVVAWPDVIGTPYVPWRTEGYIFSTQAPGTIPLKLYWSDARRDYLTIATAEGEADALAAGYKFMWVEGYVCP